jgi:peptidyl-prolyl cis-trans isomerase SurA
MFKIISIIITFINFSLGVVMAENKYEIILNIDKDIITNFDIQKESKYLIALNPSLKNATKDQIKKISRESLVRETIKENEILKYYQINYEDPKLMVFTRDIYSKLGIKNDNDFDGYLLKFDLDTSEIIRKIAIEKAWNQLIFDKYKNMVSVDEEKIKDNLKNDQNKLKTQTSFLISEILFDPKDEVEFKNLHKDIIKMIKENDFKTAASIYSISDSSKNSGLIGWVNKNEISNLIYNELNRLNIGEHTPPIKIASGFLIIYLNDLKKVEQKKNSEEELQRIIVADKNRQLNQYSIIYYKKIKQQIFIYEK